MATVERVHAAHVLGVDITATPRQVHEAFRRRAREVHPDATGGDAGAMVELNAAYRALTAPTAPDWEFFSDAGSEPATAWSDGPFDEGCDSPVRDGLALRRFEIALVAVGVVMTTIVFIVAIGYDWSLSP